MVLNDVERGQARALVDTPRSVALKEGAGVARFVEKEIFEVVHVVVWSARHREKEKDEIRSDRATDPGEDHYNHYTGIGLFPLSAEPARKNRNAARTSPYCRFLCSGIEPD